MYGESFSQGSRLSRELKIRSGMVVKPQGSTLTPIQCLLYNCCGCTWFVPFSEQGSVSETIICCRAGGQSVHGEVFPLPGAAQGRQLLEASHPLHCQSEQPGQLWGGVRASLTALPGVSHPWMEGCVFPAQQFFCQCGREELSLVGPSMFQGRIQSSTNTAQFTSLWARICD